MTTQVRFGAPVSGLLKNSNDDFLGAVVWRPSETAKYGNTDFSLRTIGMCWKQQSLERRPPRLKSGTPRFGTLDSEIAKADENSILAVLGKVRDETSPTRRPSKGSLKKQAKQNTRLSRETTERLRLWMSGSAAEAEDSAVALLACCELLLLYGSQFPAEVIGGLWRVTLAGALAQAESFANAAGIDDWETYASEEDADRETWIKAGLLPLVCGMLFDDVKGAPRLRRTGRSSLNDQLLQTTFSDGTPVVPVFAALPDYLALWSDGMLVTCLFEARLWKKTAAKRFEKMLRRLAAAVRDGGVMTCVDDGESAAVAISTATELHGSSPTDVWVKSLELSATPIHKRSESRKASGSGKRKSNRKIAKAAIPSWQSDDTDAACLRTSWDPDASLATIRHDCEPALLELAIEGVPVIAGRWGLELSENGEVLELEDEWECICWSSDSDGDFLELQLEFEGGPMISRFLYLSRTQQFAVVSDIVSEATPGRLELAGILPLADGVTLKSDGPSREQILSAGQTDVRVFPLVLPQDPGVGTEGQVGLDHHNDSPCLTVSAASESGTMFSPIVLDWAPDRRTAPVEWRKLTVTRAGEIDPSGAAAYRLQLGKQHLVLYRALSGTERYRTFLGYQAESETVIGQFTKSGVIQELLIVE